MKILVCDADDSVKKLFSERLAGHEVSYVDGPVTEKTATEHFDAEAVSVFVSSSVTKPIINAFPNLKLIAARSTGVDHIDVAAAKERGVIVCNVPKYGARTVAEFTFALMLGLSRRLPTAARQVKEDGDFHTAALEGFDLFGKTLGVIGTGSIGANVVEIALAFGMNVLMYDPHPNEKLSSTKASYVPLQELFAKADIVTLHVPYTKDTHHLINAEALSQMKRGVFIVNTARGELIDTQALLESLQSGQVTGAGLDVLEEERVLKDEMELVKGSESIQSLKAIIRNHVLRDIPRVIITPHIAFFSKEAYHEILETTIFNISSFANGTPINTV